MNIYLQLTLLSALVVFVVDLSGFTDAWTGALARWLHRPHIRPVKPFSCSLCMTWWCGLVWAIVAGQFRLPVVAFVALLAYLTPVISMLLYALREALRYLADKLIIEW